MVERLLTLFFTALLLAGAAGPLSAGEPSAEALKAWGQCQKEVGAAKIRGDFDAARSALRSFAESYPEAPQAAAAREELKTIAAAADKQLTAIWEDAEAFSARKRYDKALELYSELLTRNPGPDWIRKAREAVERNDAAAEQVFAKNKKRAEEAFAAWNFTDAAKQAEKGREDLTGTKWAEPAARLVSETEAVRALFAGVIAKVKATEASPKKTPFMIADLTGWKVRGEIVKADEQKLSVMVTGAGQELPWKDMAPERMLELLNLYGLSPQDQFGLGVLFLRMGKKDAAGPRFMAARADAALFDAAEYYLKVIAGQLNLIAYDFSQGLQILDWEARGGRWLILKGELVQDGVEGEGELGLTKTTCKLKELRLFFELTDRGGKGAVSVVLLKDGQNSLGFTFSREDGYSAYASLDGKITTVKDAKFKLEADKRVRVRCGLKGDEFGLSVDNAKLPRLEVPGLAKLEGLKLTLRTLDCKAAFDNFEVVNRSE
jgi:tetratricopeptide (TPR) repeat protein